MRYKWQNTMIKRKRSLSWIKHQGSTECCLQGCNDNINTQKNVESKKMKKYILWEIQMLKSVMAALIPDKVNYKTKNYDERF